MCLVLSGPGNSGKSKFVDLITWAAGKAMVPGMQIDKLFVSPKQKSFGSNGHSDATVHGIRKARVICWKEVDKIGDGLVTNVPFLKYITGETFISGSQKNEKNTTFEIEGITVICTNLISLPVRADWNLEPMYKRFVFLRHECCFTNTVINKHDFTLDCCVDL